MQTTKEVELSEKLDDHSHAEVSVILDTDEARVKNSLSINAHADTEDERVWLSIRFHHYSRLGNVWQDEQSNSGGFDLISQNFSRAEIEALAEVLSHELEKFKAYDKEYAEAEQPVFI